MLGTLPSSQPLHLSEAQKLAVSAVGLRLVPVQAVAGGLCGALPVEVVAKL